MKLGEARLPDGLRLYAIGDVHGCDDLLAEMHQRIAADIAAASPGAHRIVHLGDYIDRGGDSAAVIERVSRLSQADENVVCLRGNHEELLLEFLTGDPAAEANFVGNGGDMTLASYGIAAGRWRVTRGRNRTLAARFGERLPQDHRSFLEGLPYSVRFGDYFLCHAGVRPGIPLGEQDPYDLVWIRRQFLDSDSDFGAVVVHGHTPVKEPEIRSNRINVDTGAVLGGGLTCLVLEGGDYRFLQVK